MRTRCTALLAREGCHFSEVAWLAYYDAASVPGVETIEVAEIGERLLTEFLQAIQLIAVAAKASSDWGEVADLLRFQRKIEGRTSLLKILLNEGVDQADDEARSRLEARVAAMSS